MQMPRKAQRLGQVLHAHPSQVFAADNGDGRRDVGEALDAARRRRHIGVGEFLDRKLFEI